MFENQVQDLVPLTGVVYYLHNLVRYKGLNR
jgi:hypothetical protein